MRTFKEFEEAENEMIKYFETMIKNLEKDKLETDNEEVKNKIECVVKDLIHQIEMKKKQMELLKFLEN